MLQQRMFRLLFKKVMFLLNILNAYTTTGMGIDQGKTGNINALALLAKETGSSITNVGTTTYRPPFTPITFGALSGGRVENLIQTFALYLNTFLA